MAPACLPKGELSLQGCRIRGVHWPDYPVQLLHEDAAGGEGEGTSQAPPPPQERSVQKVRRSPLCSQRPDSQIKNQTPREIKVPPSDLLLLWLPKEIRPK